MGFRGIDTSLKLRLLGNPARWNHGAVWMMYVNWNGFLLRWLHEAGCHCRRMSETWKLPHGKMKIFSEQETQDGVACRSLAEHIRQTLPLIMVPAVSFPWHHQSLCKHQVPGSCRCQGVYLGVQEEMGTPGFQCSLDFANFRDCWE